VTGESEESFAEGLTLVNLALAFGLVLDKWQRAILDPEIRRGILNCCRKWGKSTMIALKALHFALTRPGTTVLVVAPSSRQSEELLAIAGRMMRDSKVPGTYAQERITLPNGSRILALPNQPRTIRGFSPELLIVDEAAYLPEDIWDAVFPMLNAAEGGGWLWLMSTPAQPTGFFHRLWTDKSPKWTRLKVTAYDCPRISPEIIAEAKRSFSPERFAREYLCEFAQPVTAAFPEDIVRACVDPRMPEFFSTPVKYPMPAAPQRARPHAYVGVDLGKCSDPAAIAIVEFASEPRHTVDPVTRAPLFDCWLNLRYLESPPLGTPYLELVPHVQAMALRPRLRKQCTLLVDAGGPGEPVVELFQQAPVMTPMIPVKITAGSEAREDKGVHYVAKKVLMDRLEYVLRRRKLRIVAGPVTEQLIRQFTLLKREVTESGNVTFPTASGEHDDLVMATAMAVWRAWEVHEHYLAKSGPVAIVSEAGILHEHRHPLFSGAGAALAKRMLERGGWD